MKLPLQIKKNYRQIKNIENQIIKANWNDCRNK